MSSTHDVTELGPSTARTANARSGRSRGGPDTTRSHDAGPDRGAEESGDFDLVRIYLRDLERSRPLTAEQELGLGRAREQGEAIARRAVLSTPLAARRLLAFFRGLEDDPAALAGHLVGEREAGLSLAERASRVRGRVARLCRVDSRRRVLRAALRDDGLSLDQRRALEAHVTGLVEAQVACLQTLLLEPTRIDAIARELTGHAQRVECAIRRLRAAGVPGTESASHDDVLAWLRASADRGEPRAREGGGAEPALRRVRLLIRTAEVTTGLTVEELSYAARQIRLGTERSEASSRALVEAHLRLVVFIARRYTQRGLPLLDLIQEGNLGLMRAASKYDHRMGYRFSTYAVWWIRQTIQRALSNHSSTIRLPVHVHNLLLSVRRSRRRLEQSLGREPSLLEIAELLELPPSVAQTLPALDGRFVSLEGLLPDGGSRSPGRDLEDEHTPAPSDQVVFHELEQQTLKVLASLPVREERVLRLRYGIGLGQGHSLEEVGRHLSVSRERVRQIESVALQRLRLPELRRELAEFAE